MSWEILFVVALLLFAIASFVLEKIPADLTAVCVFAALLIAGSLAPQSTLPGVSDLLAVFSSAAPLTIAAMFILSAGLERSGALDILADTLQRLTKLGYARFLVVLILVVAFLSAFVNNTPIVIVFLPVLLSLAKSLGVAPSKLLIPLSYASIAGGTSTLVGTSTNLLASGLLAGDGHEPLHMFELAWVGIPLVLATAAYLALFGRHLLPNRESLTSILSEEERKEYLAEAYIPPGSPVAGKAIKDTPLAKATSIRVLEIIRHEVALRVKSAKTILQEGDRLVLACRPSGVAQARSMEGVRLQAEEAAGLETISAHEGLLVEGVIGPRSTIAGRTVREINFRQRFRVILIAVHRRGVNLRERIDEIPLEFGDTLLLMGTEDGIENLRRNDDILLLDRPHVPSTRRRGVVTLTVGVTLGVVAAATLGILPIVAAAVLGVAALLVTGCVEPKKAYENIEWRVLILIYGMMSLGVAMQSTGLDTIVAGSLQGLAGVDLWGLGGPVLLIAALYLVTMVLTEAVSNNATVVLMTPIALRLGETLQIDPRAFVVAVCIAASASFATPIGYQTNTLVYNAGGYRFTDFTRVGLPLNLISFTVAVLVIPRVWGF